MAASVGDKFTDTYNAANPNVARVTVARTAAATSLSCDNLAGWPTATKVHFSTYQIDTSNAVVAGTQIDWYGIVSGNTIGSLTRITGASDTGSSVGDVVEMNPTASWAHDLYSGLAVEHNNNGTHGAVTATSVTTSGAVLTTPKVITSLDDTNGNELFKVTATGSAVNEVTVTNAATGNAPSLAATGGDTNVGLNLVSKGTGEVQLNGTNISGAWSTWTPTWANFTVGNGTTTAKSKQIGKTVTGYLKFVFGSTSAMGTAPTFTAPVTAASQYGAQRNWVGDGHIQVGGANHYVGSVEFNASTTIISITSTNVAGAYANPNAISSTIPTSGWTTGDYFVFTFTYEAA